jgi:hypothetical protein
VNSTYADLVLKWNLIDNCDWKFEKFTLEGDQLYLMTYTKAKSRPFLVDFDKLEVRDWVADPSLRRTILLIKARKFFNENI